MGKKELVVSGHNGTTRLALIENGQLAELHIETPEHARTIGNVVLGKVKKVMPNIRAAFVDIGMGQDAFLHYSDLTDNLPQMLAFVEQDDPDLRSWGVAPGMRLAKRKRRGAKRGKATDKGDREDGLDHLFAIRRRARHGPPKRQARRDLPQLKGRPEDHLKQGQRILVKISKEPMGHKGHRVSTDISLAGRFLVLVPMADYVAVSKKIGSYKERRRLRVLARSLLPEGFGVIVRTQASRKTARELDTDLKLLAERWDIIEGGMQGKPKLPKKLFEDVNMVSSLVRDLFSDDFDRILTDDKKIYDNLSLYVQAVAPHMEDAVQFYDGKRPIFDHVGIGRDYRDAFEKRVDMPGGGYLFIERTEAMHVVDVNSGRAGRGLSQEENAIRVNLESARTIARQARLRDLGGIIVVDFIDLKDNRNRKKIYDELLKEFRKDRAVTKALPMSDFGIVQITRQRLRPALTTLHKPEDDGGGDWEDEARADIEAQQTADASAARSGERSGDQRGDASRSDAAQGGRGRSDDRNARSRTDDDLSAGRTSGRGRGNQRSDKGSQRASADDRKSASTGASQSRSSSSRGSKQKRRRETPDELLALMRGWVAAYREAGRKEPLRLRVHPFLSAFLSRSVPNRTTRWSFRYLVRIKLEEDENLHPMAFRFHVAETGEEITRDITPLDLSDSAPDEAAVDLPTQPQPDGSQRPPKK